MTSFKGSKEGAMGWKAREKRKKASMFLLVMAHRVPLMTPIGRKPPYKCWRERIWYLAWEVKYWSWNSFLKNFYIAFSLLMLSMMNASPTCLRNLDFGGIVAPLVLGYLMILRVRASFSKSLILTSHNYFSAHLVKVGALLQNGRLLTIDLARFGIRRLQ